MTIPRVTKAWQVWKDTQYRAEAKREARLAALHRAHQKEERSIWREYYSDVYRANAIRNIILDQHQERFVKTG